MSFGCHTRHSPARHHTGAASLLEATPTTLLPAVYCWSGRSWLVTLLWCPRLSDAVSPNRLPKERATTELLGLLELSVFSKTLTGCLLHLPLHSEIQLGTLLVPSALRRLKGPFYCLPFSGAQV